MSATDRAIAGVRRWQGNVLGLRFRSTYPRPREQSGAL